MSDRPKLGVWLGVDAGDYETHMAAIGQAQANARLIGDLFAMAAVPAGSRVLIAGAGPGQMFDYLAADTFDAYWLICSDINERFLARVRERVECESVVDDVEASALEPGFGAIIVVLVLEHVNFAAALRSVARLRPECLIVVIQQNPASFDTAVTPGRVLPGTMQVFAGEARFRLVAFEELRGALGGYGFGLVTRQDEAVADEKVMVGALFRSVASLG